MKKIRFKKPFFLKSRVVIFLYLFILIFIVFSFLRQEAVLSNTQEILAGTEAKCFLMADRYTMRPGSVFKLIILANDSANRIKEIFYSGPKGWSFSKNCGYTQNCIKSWWISHDEIGTFEYSAGFYDGQEKWVDCQNTITINVTEEDVSVEKPIKIECNVTLDPKIVDKNEIFYLKLNAQHPDSINYAQFAREDKNYIGDIGCHNATTCTAKWPIQHDKSGSYQYWAGFYTMAEEWVECGPISVDVKDNFNILVQSSIDGRLEEGVRIIYALGLQSRLTHFLLSSWHPSTQVFRAPEVYQGYEFSHWSDCTLTPGAEGSPFKGLPIGRNCLVTVSWWPFKSDKTVVAHYKSIEPQCSWEVSPRNPVPKAKFSLYLTLKHPDAIKYAQYKLEGSDAWSDNLECNNQHICRLTEHLPAHNKAGTYKYFVRFKTAKNEWSECDAIIVNVEERENKFLLSVEITGNGSGYVFADPYEFYYSYDFSERYKEGTSVTLTAEADEDSVFLGWEGACSGQNPCIVEMTKDKSVKAVFEEMSTEEDKYFLIVEIVGRGEVSIDPSGISPYIGPNIYLYNKNETITLTALPGDDAKFIEWTGDCSGESEKCILEMTDDKIVGAVFMPPSCAKVYGDGPIGVEFIGMTTDSAGGYKFCQSQYDYDTIRYEKLSWTLPVRIAARGIDIYPFNPDDFTIYRSNIPNESACPDIHQTFFIFECGYTFFAAASLCQGMAFVSTQALSAPTAAPVTVAHELGHSFGCLCDEYIREDKEPDPYCLGCAKDKCPLEWDECFEGCNYEEKGWYRDSENSIMNHCYFVDSCSFGPAATQIIIDKIQQVLGK